GLQEVIDVYSLFIEPMCRKLKLPLHKGVVCGIAWDPASSPAQMSLADGGSIILVPESVLMLSHFVSKFLAKLLPIDVEGERLAIRCDSEVVLRILKEDEELKNY